MSEMFARVTRSSRSSVPRSGEARRRRSGRLRRKVGPKGRRLQLEALEARRCLAAAIAPLVDLPPLEIAPAAEEVTGVLVKYRQEAGSDQPGRAFGKPTSLHGPTSTTGGRAIGFGLHRVDFVRGVAVDTVIDELLGSGEILYAEPDYPVRIADTLPNDPRFGEQWDLHNIGQDSGTIDADIDAPEAWEVTTGTGSTVVAVIDTGVDYLHPDLAPNLWTNPGEVPGDGIDNDQNGYVDDVHGYDFYNGDGDPMDDHNHGTHVAGTIGAKGNDGLGIAGVNWDVQLMAIKFLGADGSGTTSDAIEAIRYAVDNGAQLSNNSWGGDPYSQAMYDVISQARDVGHVFVAAAGNGNFIGIGQDNDAQPFYPASYDLDNVVAVAATDRNDQIAVFSNYGRTSVDLAAPGVGILSTTINGTYGASSGTSMAAPHVTGALSLLRDLEPQLSYRELIDRVLLSADPLDALADVTVTGGRLNLAASLVPDTFGPQVLQAAPSGLVLDPLDRVRISFSESIDEGSFTAADILSFSGPEGEIPLTSLAPVAGSNGRQFDLVFAEQATAGQYELIIGPAISDRFGNVMDQNDNGIGGEDPDDRFVHRWTKADAVARFDYGTSTSPVAEGYTRIVGGDTYDAAVGYGWQAGAVYSLNRSGDALTTDVNYTKDATFAVDVPNGEYDVIVTLGESLAAHDEMGIWLEGVQVDSVTTAAGEHAVKTYRTSVTDGQLQLGLIDLGGSDAWVMINGLDVVFAGPDVTGPSVAVIAPEGDVLGPMDRVRVTFSEPIAEGTFTLTDIATLEGPTGPITPTAVEQLGAGEFEITFESQNTSGHYRLVLGPEVTDIAGNPMDQDGDGVNGEPVDDLFESILNLQAGPETVARFDFGTTLSPVAPGYTRIVGADGYDAGIGYGWQVGTVYSLSRGGDDLTRDVNYSTDATFALDLPNGEYDVMVTMGEVLIPHDQMGVSVEGVLVDSVTTAGSEFAVNTYRTGISDGQLNLRLVDLGGSDPWAMINALEVQFVGPDETGPVVITSDPSGAVPGPLDSIAVTFSEPLDPTSFTVEDVLALTGPAGPVTPLAVERISTGVYEIRFDPQNVSGPVDLVLSSEITDVAGNLLDQDGDGTGGESPDDHFQLSFDLSAGPEIVARFDFGTTLSPIAEDYTRIVGGDKYSASVGYGWQTGWVYALSRGGDDLTRDLNYTKDATFALDVADGDYDVTVTLGEALIAHDQMGLSLEGTQVDTISTAGGEFVVRTYRVSVLDGQLNVRLQDLGGSNVWAVINAMEVARVAASG